MAGAGAGAGAGAAGAGARAAAAVQPQRLPSLGPDHVSATGPMAAAAAALRPGGFTLLGAAGCAPGCATCFTPNGAQQPQQQTGSRPPRRHPCWVCAVKEEDNVPEPPLWRLGLNALGDSNWPRALSTARSRRYALALALGGVFAAAALPVALAEAGAVPDDGMYEFILTASPAEHGTAFAVSLLALLLFNAFTVTDNQDPQLKAVATAAKPDSAAAKKADQLHAELLAGAIRCKTVSFDDTSQIDYSEFPKLHKYLERSFPLTHKALKRTIINQCEYTSTPTVARAFWTIYHVFAVIP